MTKSTLRKTPVKSRDQPMKSPSSKIIKRSPPVNMKSLKSQKKSQVKKEKQEYKNKILDRLLPDRPAVEKSSALQKKVMKLQKLKDQAMKLEQEIQDESKKMSSSKNTHSVKSLSINSKLGRSKGSTTNLLRSKISFLLL